MRNECYLIISDLHGIEEGECLVKKAIDKYKPKGIISAGDQCPNPYEPLYSSLIAVRGNCDSYYSYGDLPFPPLFREIELFGRKCIITHGDRYSIEDFTKEDGLIFIFGHSHVPHLEKRDSLYLLNPGSPSRPRSSSGPTAALLFPFGLEIVSLLDFKVLSTLSFSDKNKF